MPTPFENFSRVYRSQRDRLKREKEAAAEAAVRYEEGVLMAGHEADQAREAAIAERRRTISMAQSVSMLLRVCDIRPEREEIYEEPIFEARRWSRERFQTGTRKQIALEGWTLPIASGDRLASPAHLVLTSDTNINNHPALVWHDSTFINSPTTAAVLTKQDIRVLPATPLSPEDMPWYSPPVKLPRNKLLARLTEAYYPEFIPQELTATQQHEQEMRVNKGFASPQDYNAYLDMKQEAPDYEMYRKAKIEQKIRLVITTLAARYDVLDLN